MAFIPADKKVSQLPPGTLSLGSVGGSFVLLANVDGQIYATSGICPHAGAALNYGRLDGPEVECPLHGAVFDVTDGEVVMGPAPFGLIPYPVKVEGDEIFVDLE